MYQLQNLKDIHNLDAHGESSTLLYRNVSIAKFEGYTQQYTVTMNVKVGCIGMYQLQNLKDIHNPWQK